MKKITFVFMMLLIVLFFNILDANSHGDVAPEEYSLELYRAKVIDVTEKMGVDETLVQEAKVKILNNDLKGTIGKIVNTLTGDEVYDINLEKGLKVSVHVQKDTEGNNLFFLMGYDRVGAVFQIVLIFFIALLLIGGVKGIKAILALILTILLLFYFFIPLLLEGYNPIILAISTCAISTVVTLIIIGGWNKKSFSAIVGTISGVAIGGLIAYIYGVTAMLTGIDSAEAQMLTYLPGGAEFDFRGILFAGILIGALGATMDVSISISSALTELVSKDSNLGFKQILKHGMNIGRDVMGTMVNTLILAYTGGALSIMLIFVAFEKTLYEVLNLESFVAEIVRAMAGSVGLVLAIPFTALAFAYLTKLNSAKG